MTTSDRERAMIRDDFGVDDASPVFAEDFIQWVLEDNFPAGRPPLEDAGVEFVADGYRFAQRSRGEWVPVADRGLRATTLPKSSSGTRPDSLTASSTASAVDIE